MHTSSEVFYWYYYYKAGNSFVITIKKVVMFPGSASQHMTLRVLITHRHKCNPDIQISCRTYACFIDTASKYTYYKQISSSYWVKSTRPLLLPTGDSILFSNYSVFCLQYYHQCNNLWHTRKPQATYFSGLLLLKKNKNKPTNQPQIVKKNPSWQQLTISGQHQCPLHS